MHVWVDDLGVAHTASLPDPTHVLSDDFRADLDSIALSDPDALQDVIGLAEEQVYETGWLELSVSDEYVGATPPAALLRGRPANASDVASAIARTDVRWRLDVILALDDYLT